MARRIAVEIVGDSRLLERAFSRSTRSAKRFDAQISGVGRSVTRSFAGATAAILGGAGLVHAIRASISGASDLGEQMSKTEVVFGESGDAVVAWAHTLADSFGLSTREALTLSSTFGAILRPLGFATDEAAKQSQQLTELGADLASFYNTSVTDALDALRAGIVGQARPLLKYGVVVKAARVQTEALRETGKRSATQLTEQEKAVARLAIIYKDSSLAQGDFARTSDHLAQQTKIAQANIENLRDSIGIALVPAVNRVVSSFNDWLKTGDNQKQLVKDLRSAADALVDVFDKLRGAFARLNDVTGSGRNSLKLLLGVLLAYKGLKILGGLASIASSIGLIGTNAKRSTGQVAGLRGGLVSLRSLGLIAIPVLITLGIEQTAAYKKFRKEAKDKGAGLLLAPIQDIVKEAKRDLAPVGKELGDQLKDEFNKPDGPFQVIGRLTGLIKDKASDEIGLPILDMQRKISKLARSRPGQVQVRPTIDTGTARTGLTKKELAERRARIREAREALRQEIVDRAELAVDRAGLTKTLNDDLSALNKLNALLKRRIAGGHATIELERQQLGVEKEIADLLEQQAEQRKAARAARQFRLLGFGPTGEDLVPGVKGLKKQLAAVADVVSGSFLDTKKTRGLLAHIRQVLAGGLGKVGAEVRAKIAQILADLKQQLKQAQVDTTKFQKVAPGILGALGLTPAQRKVLARILPQLGPGGTVPSSSGQFAGAGAVTIQGGIHLHGVQNVKQLENELQKRRKQRARARRGNR